MNEGSNQHDIREIVVFDFDGTITTKDTFALFLRYYAGAFVWFVKILTLLPVFLAYGLRIMDRNQVKHAVIRRFFANQAVDKVQAKAESFAKDVIPTLIRPKARETLMDKRAAEKSGGESLYICSASITPYLKAYFETLDIHQVLATELESVNGVYTGGLKGWNIWGEGKMRRILAEFAPLPVEIIEAYGDSRGDREMLHAAKASFWRPFRL